jgi:phage tail protein X
MWIALTQGERKLAELATRVYGIEPPGVRAKTKQAADALLEANPELAGLATLPAGTHVVVPDVEGIEPAEGQVQAVETAATGSLGDELRASLSGAASALAAAVDEHEAVASATLEVLGSREAKQAAADDPELRARTAAAIDAVKGAQKDAAALRTYHDRVLAQLDRDLDDLLGTLSS